MILRQKLDTIFSAINFVSYIRSIAPDALKYSMKNKTKMIDNFIQVTIIFILSELDQV